MKMMDIYQKKLFLVFHTKKKKKERNKYSLKLIPNIQMVSWTIKKPNSNGIPAMGGIAKLLTSSEIRGLHH